MKKELKTIIANLELHKGKYTTLEEIISMVKEQTSEKVIHRDITGKIHGMQTHCSIIEVLETKIAIEYFPSLIKGEIYIIGVDNDHYSRELSKTIDELADLELDDDGRLIHKFRMFGVGTPYSEVLDWVNFLAGNASTKKYSHL